MSLTAWHVPNYRYGYRSLDELIDVVQQYDAHGIPLEVVWSDLDYTDRWGTGHGSMRTASLQCTPACLGAVCAVRGITLPLPTQSTKASHRLLGLLLAHFLPSTHRPATDCRTGIC